MSKAAKRRARKKRVEAKVQASLGSIGTTTQTDTSLMLKNAASKQANRRNESRANAANRRNESAEVKEIQETKPLFHIFTSVTGINGINNLDDFRKYLRQTGKI